MKTPEEIVARIREVEKSDIFGTATSDLLEYLPFEQAKPWLQDSVTSDEWDKVRAAQTPAQHIVDYLSFAWEKANDCRGLSANRSLMHFEAWLWLDGRGAVADRLFDDYAYYGKPSLVLVSELYGFDWKAHDNGKWVSRENEDGVPDDLRNELIETALNRAASAKAEAVA